MRNAQDALIKELSDFLELLLNPTQRARDAAEIGRRGGHFDLPKAVAGTAKDTIDTVVDAVDDIDLPNQVLSYILRSPHAHARIRSIDTQVAARAPGVLAVYTGKDIASAG